MSPAEWVHRIRGAGLILWLKTERLLRFRLDRPIAWGRFAFCTASAPQLPRLSMSFEPSDEEKQQLLDGDFGALSLPWKWTPDVAIWHTAPDTGAVWPAHFFGSIPIRPGNRYGDARIVWEPSRLQGLVGLALLANHDARCAGRAGNLLEEILESWIRSNPYLAGVHYVSAMECALRMIAVCHALDLMRGNGARGEATWSGFVGLVESHAALIYRRLSLHSSAGNHTIAECAGLIYAGLVLPEHRQASLWRARGLGTLESEAARQVLQDGGGIEQAVWYQLFVIDLLGMVQELLVWRRQVVPPQISAAVTRGREFLGALGSRPEELPRIGDADGGFALSRHLRISLATEERRSPEVITFPDSGYTVCQPSQASGLRIVIDHGPLGMPPGYGHGHADALSLVVTANASELLIDPGTYAYNRGNEWRRYFRSTRAHNTVTVDGLDQAVQEGAFQWSAPYQTRFVRAGGGRIIMSHTGYARVGIIHSRTVLVRPYGQLVIWDRLEGAGQHEFELNWHLGSEPLAFRRDTGELEFQNGYRLRVLGGHCRILTGETDPPSGWVSPDYGAKVATPTLRIVARARAPHEFVTFLLPNGAAIDLDRELDELRSAAACLESA
jgi:hypothetical protein